MGNHEHTYAARLMWDGNTGEGTRSYTGYGRRYRVSIAGKPDLVGSADAAFRGDVDVHNPEDLFLSAVAACHMLAYLALCARCGIRVVAYEDDARATLRVDGGGGGRFAGVTLRPVVTITDQEDTMRAIEMHDVAHAGCFIANSCSVPIQCEPTVLVSP